MQELLPGQEIQKKRPLLLKEKKLVQVVKMQELLPAQEIQKKRPLLLKEKKLVQVVRMLVPLLVQESRLPWMKAQLLLKKELQLPKRKLP